MPHGVRCAVDQALVAYIVTCQALGVHLGPGGRLNSAVSVWGWLEIVGEALETQIWATRGWTLEDQWRSLGLVEQGPGEEGWDLKS